MLIEENVRVHCRGLERGTWGQVESQTEFKQIRNTPYETRDFPIAAVAAAH